MRTPLIRWTESFPYRGGRALVARLSHGWRLGLDGDEAQASTLVGAFESLRRRPAGDAEMRVVLAAFARDRGAAARSSSPRPDHSK
jgi:hypothetical protein